MKSILSGILAIFGFILIITLFTVIPVWLLWNWLMPMIFGLPKLTILQAFGLDLLCNFLFGNSFKKED